MEELINATRKGNNLDWKVEVVWPYPTLLLLLHLHLLLRNENTIRDHSDQVQLH